VCDGADNDCDGRIDIDAIDVTSWYADADADGYTTAATSTACDQPEGYRAAATQLPPESVAASPARGLRS